jgi:hypothetical protein
LLVILRVNPFIILQPKKSPCYKHVSSYKLWQTVG